MKLYGGGASFSDDGLYRWDLTRTWGDGPHALVVGHNPSTADGSRDDQTIRRLRQLLAAEGYGGFTIVNLFAYRSTDPRTLREVLGPEGSENATVIARAVNGARVVIVAWGGSSPLGTDAELQREYVLKCARRCLRPVLCFGYTKDGAPRHPSRLPRSAKLELFK